MKQVRPVGVVAMVAGLALMTGIGAVWARTSTQDEIPELQIRSASSSPDPVQPSGMAVALSPLLQYQGRLTNPSTGQPVVDGVVAMTFRLYDVAAGGSALWTETKNVPVTGGLFNAALGDTTPLSQRLFDGRALWLGVTVAADLEATPRQPILPAAYAISLLPGATMSATGATPVLSATNTGTTVVLSSTSAVGLQAGTASITPGQAGVLGIAGADSGVVPSQEAGVMGRASDGFGVAGTSSTQTGVYGYSTSGYGVRGEASGSGPAVYGYNAGTGYGGYFYSSGYFGGYFFGANGRALYASGSITATGNIKAFGQVRGAYTALPIAYGFVNSADGSLLSGSGNVSGAWNSGLSRYEITIAGESFFFSSYVAQITMPTSCSYANSARTSSSGGKLLVYIYNGTGTLTQCGFQFVVYKP
jgi:hypothetical protein